MKITNVAFVGYPVTDVARARHFYEKVLGLKTGEIVHDADGSEPGNMSWIEYDINGQTLAISNAWPPSGQSGPSIALEVENLEEAVAHLKKEGVNITMEHVPSPVCDMAIIQDPDGNTIVIHKLKPHSH
ncbi:MAG: VOC family protein [Candidatus Methylacidiphilales bacterium]|nr:VOC family protein [Candidatus Methylacidiphilales bacterium]